MEQEIWKTCPLEPNYEVSSSGRVRNKDTKHVKSLRYDNNHYLRVTLYPSGKTYTVHKLVATTFLEKGDATQVNHKDGNKENNRVSNLEWCDGSWNSKHRDTKLMSKWKGSLNPEAKLTVDDVKRIKSGEFDGLSNAEVGKIFGVLDECIRLIRKGVNWSHIN